MRERTLGFVWGYLPYIDRLSKTAKRLGLLQRFSLAFNRYPDSCPGLYEIAFDPEFILGLFGVLLPIFPHDTLTVIDEVGTSHPDLVSACRIDPDYGEQESFASAILHLGGRETCYIEYLAYGRCGGPHPYHDAYVYGVYCKDIERQPVQDALFSYCLESRIPLADIISGSPHPVPKPWYREILDFIFPIWVSDPCNSINAAFEWPDIKQDLKALQETTIEDGEDILPSGFQMEIRAEAAVRAL